MFHVTLICRHFPVFKLLLENTTKYNHPQGAHASTHQRSYQIGLLIGTEVERVPDPNHQSTHAHTHARARTQSHKYQLQTGFTRKPRFDLRTVRPGRTRTQRHCLHQLKDRRMKPGEVQGGESSWNKRHPFIKNKRTKPRCTQSKECLLPAVEKESFSRSLRMQ